MAAHFFKYTKAVLRGVLPGSFARKNERCSLLSVVIRMTPRQPGRHLGNRFAHSFVHTVDITRPIGSDQERSLDEFGLHDVEAMWCLSSENSSSENSFGFKQIEGILAYFHSLLRAVKLMEDSCENPMRR